MSDINHFYSDESLFRLVVEASPAAMLICDERGKILLANRAAVNYFGFSLDELMQGGIEMLIPDAHRRSHEAHRKDYMANPRTRSMAAGRDLHAVRKDGTLFPVDISLHPIVTANGRLVLANVLDATDRLKALKAERAKEALERLSFLGQVAGGVAHEIRTPLCVIANAVYFLEIACTELDDESKACLGEINREVAKANRIVTELLEFTRDVPSNCSAVSAQAILRAALKTSPPPPQIQVEWVDRHEEEFVLADAGQIERILGNLLRNAYQSIFGEGTLRLNVTRTENEIWIEVRDSGAGVSEENQKRIFEPLFTTKSTGFGLGLTISRRYAERNGGRLELVSSPGEGACFRVALRRVESPLDSSAD